MYKGFLKAIISGAAFGLMFAPPLFAATKQPKIKLSGLHVMPSSDSEVGTVKKAMPGDEIISTGLTFEDTAKLATVARLVISDIPIVLDTRSPLLGASGIGLPAATFCTSKVEVSKAVRATKGNASGEKRPARFDREVRFCLIDADQDKNFESAFIQGANWAEDFNHTSIKPIEYTASKFTEIAGQLRLIFTRGAPLQGPVLEMQSTLLNGSFQFSGARIGPEPKKAKMLAGERSVRAKVFPKTLDYGDAQITILALHPDTRELTYRIDRRFERSPAIVEVMMLGMYGGSIYIFE